MKKTLNFTWVILLLIMASNAFSAAKKEMIGDRYKSLELLTKVIYMIENQYYKSVNHNTLVEGAISGMVATLDPHSSFLNKKLMKKVKDDTEGHFGGVGIEVYRKDGAVHIINVMEGSPAHKSKVLAGDRIVEIDNKSVIGHSFEQVIELLQGEIGQKLTLGVTREGESKIHKHKLTRRVIKIQPVVGTIINNTIAYIRLIQFQENAARDVERKLKSLKKKYDVDGIILDLRGNPGGLLDEAVDLSSLFLKNGVVVSTESRDPSHKDIRYVKKSSYKDVSTPMVVLINGSSASASEIVAGALQDYERALIVGGASFGKGSVQSVSQINNEVGIKLTIAQYLTPKKRKIQAVGIMPDISLRDIDLVWLENEKKERKYLREKDLNNHLEASTFKSKKTRGKKKKKKTSLDLKLALDYQVQQSLKILSSAKFFKR